MGYAEAMDRYGVDKPDLRFGMELKDVSKILRESSFRVFKEALKKGGIIKALCVKGGGSFSRKEIDGLIPIVETYGAKGLMWAKVGTDGWQSPIQKFLTPEEMKEVEERCEASMNDLLLFIADLPKVVHQALGNLRLHLGERPGSDFARRVSVCLDPGFSAPGI